VQSADSSQRCDGLLRSVGEQVEDVMLVGSATQTVNSVDEANTPSSREAMMGTDDDAEQLESHSNTANMPLDNQHTTSVSSTTQFVSGL